MVARRPGVEVVVTLFMKPPEVGTLPFSESPRVGFPGWVGFGFGRTRDCFHRPACAGTYDWSYDVNAGMQRRPGEGLGWSEKLWILGAGLPCMSGLGTEVVIEIGTWKFTIHVPNAIKLCATLSMALRRGISMLE